MFNCYLCLFIMKHTAVKAYGRRRSEAVLNSEACREACIGREGFLSRWVVDNVVLLVFPSSPSSFTIPHKKSLARYFLSPYSVGVSSIYTTQAEDLYPIPPHQPEQLPTPGLALLQGLGVMGLPREQGVRAEGWKLQDLFFTLYFSFSTSFYSSSPLVFFWILRNSELSNFSSRALT